MSVDMTQNFIDMDIKTDDWQNQVIDAFSAVDGGADVTANDAQAYATKDEANANGCVRTQAGKNVKVDGSAFLYVNERFTTQQTNEASGLSVAAKIDDKVRSAIQRTQ